MSAGHNGLGTRVRRTLAGVTTRYLYDGDDLAAEVDGSDALSAKVSVCGAGNVKSEVTSGFYGTVTLPGVSIPWGVKNVRDGTGWSGWRWAGTPSVEVPIGGKIGLLGGGAAKYKLGDAFRCWVKACAR